MKIGEAAAASGCNLQTIRYYERIGLLPRAGRTCSGYRVYTSDDVARIRFISRGRDLGFSLEEIRSLLSLAEDSQLSCEQVDALARHHLAEVRAREKELRRIARELERTIAGCAGGRRAACSILAALNQAEWPTPSKRRANVHRAV